MNTNKKQVLFLVMRKMTSLFGKLHLYFLGKLIAKPRFNYCIRFLESKIPITMAEKYEYRNLEKVQGKLKIFVMWLQGEDKMPEVVKKCWESIKMHATSVGTPILITKDNLQEYLELPDYILQKVNEGRISFTQFSDIVRSGLLSKWGGVWIDSTVFLSSDIPNDYIERAFFCPSGIGNTVKTEWGLLYGNSNGWCFWFCGSMYRRYPVFTFVHNAFLEYFRSEDASIDYFMFDFFVTIFYRISPEFRECIVNQPANNICAYNLMSLMEKVVNKKNIATWNTIKTTGFINKTTYKKHYVRKLKNGKQTMYDYVMFGEK